MVVFHKATLILKVFRSEELTGEEKTKLALRKLRTCLNFITAR